MKTPWFGRVLLCLCVIVPLRCDARAGLSEGVLASVCPRCSDAPQYGESGVFLNQLWLQRRWKTSLCPGAEAGCMVVAAGDTTGRRQEPVFDNPRSVLDFLLRSLPEMNTVLPSERYFYYKFWLGDRLVSGNLRFVDVERSVLYMGYFDQNDRSQVRTATWGGADDAAVRYDAFHRVATVSSRGISRAFVLDRRWDCWPSALVLQESERFVSGVLDESGFCFSLLFDEDSSGFYFVLNEDMPLPETLVPREAPYADYLLGVESRFVFFRDPRTRRAVLVGVDAGQVRENSFYDGPFDQVPPDLEIGGLVERAYPYVLLRGGVDRHGNFKSVNGQRIAISPYQTYESLSELLPTLDWCRLSVEPGRPPWLRMVREWKRDFSRVPPVNEPPEGAPMHGVDRSRTWPANHWRSSSDLWPVEHDQASSVRWPPRHDASISTGVPNNP